MLLIDANAILRYILNDNEEMADQVEQLLATKFVSVKNEVLAEVIYVLEKVYQLSREDIASVATEFMDLENVYADDMPVTMLALETFSQTKLDFVDTLLYSYHIIRQATIFTFDKKLLSKIRNSP